MILQLCDFCGGEMKSGEQAASLILRKQGTRDPRSMGMFGLFMEEAATAERRELEMCGACLGHLLPVSERLKAEADRRRWAERRYPSGAPGVLSITKMSAEMDRVVREHLQKPRGGE